MKREEAEVTPEKPHKFIASEFEEKWQKKWQTEKVYQPDLDKARKPFYNLMMFPYPSAEGMHVGNMYAFTGADIYGRYKRMQGNDVFEPIGLDGFGIHSENYAIKVGKHPAEQAKISEANFYRQMRATGNAYDWSRTIETYDPKYYKWTQWVFLQLFKAGLAYRKKAPVNYCPKDKTVLADEQVIDGKCERCGAEVEKRNLEQWFFRITKYADRLLKNLDKINWAEKVKIAQREWIGKSEGMEITFHVENTEEKIVIYTVYPETIYGVTYMVVAPEYPLLEMLTVDSQKKAVDAYLAEVKTKSEMERTATDKTKTGVFTGSFCINPVNGQKVPIWVADYVIGSYGTGAVMGVPGSDHRDFAFATKYKLPIFRVIGETEKDTGPVSTEEQVLEEGVLVNSKDFTGVKTPHPAREQVKDFLEAQKFGKRKNQYHLRDWLISRQRYWGPPIPLINCQKCGWVPVPEKDLPVLLPDVTDWKPKGSGESPLASVESFVNTTCPKCGAPAKRETDVSDTFLDSAWYFMRYIATEVEDNAFDTFRNSKWLPVTMYIGGAEHSVLHLLYARFITMVFKDLGFIDFEEPFKQFYAHGLLIKEGAKMSKSKGNVIIPDAYIKKYGADTLRSYLMFLGPFIHGGDFYDTGIEGMHRFLQRVWRLTAEQPKGEKSEDYAKVMHKAIKQVTDDMERLHFNTALAHIMEYYNQISSSKSQITKEQGETLLLLLAPFAPHLTEDIWQKLHAGKSQSFQTIHTQPWPKYDSKMLVEDSVTITVQVNGKFRAIFAASQDEAREQRFIEEKAKEQERVSNQLEGNHIKKVIYIPGKVINFVI